MVFTCEVAGTDLQWIVISSPAESIVSIVFDSMTPADMRTTTENGFTAVLLSPGPPLVSTLSTVVSSSSDGLMVSCFEVAPTLVGNTTIQIAGECNHHCVCDDVVQPGLLNQFLISTIPNNLRHS